jgi:hypothetical protein
MADEIFETVENRIQLTEDFSNQTIDYAVRCIGHRLSKQFPNSDIEAATTNVGIKSVAVYDKDRNNEFVSFVLIGHRYRGKFLSVNENVLSLFENLGKLPNILFQVYDIKNRKIYSFDTEYGEKAGYEFDGAKFIFNTDYAGRSEDISGGELLALSMGTDSEFDADGNKKNASGAE